MTKRQIYVDRWDEFIYHYVTSWLFYSKGSTYIYFRHKDWYV